MNYTHNLFHANFADKVVLVVGGSSGIGNGIAQAFNSCGAKVHVWGTRKSESDYSVDEGCDLAGLHYRQVDVTDFTAVERHVSTFQTLDVLILAQGIVIYKRGEFDMTGFTRVVDTNLNSLMACALKYHDMLQDSRGSLITVSSTAAFHVTVGNPAYNASKAGAFALTRSLAAAWASDGIRVNGIAPGFVDTKLTAVTTKNPQRLAKALQRIPLGRLGTVQDIAGAALFLASPMAAYVVGHTIPVDGGLLLA